MKSPTSTSDDLPNVSGYLVRSQIYANVKTIAYKAIQEATQRSVIIQLQRQVYSDEREHALLPNQYAISKDLNIPGIVEIYEVALQQDQVMIVMEDFGGVSLTQYAQQLTVQSIVNKGAGDETTTSNFALHLQQFLLIAIRTAEILEELHKQGIIHKNIKPDSILVHPESKQVKLVYLSMVLELSEQQQNTQLSQSQKSLSEYLVPERADQIDQRLDYQSDLFALGVTFYELLTGQILLPVNQSPNDSYISQSPAPIQNLNALVPKALVTIIEKLIAKNPEHQYQNAAELKHALKACLLSEKETKEIPTELTVEKDLNSQFFIPQKLYGREPEIQTLLASLDRVCQGTTELLLVAGSSGVGKTTVIKQLQHAIAQKEGIFISGKFDQFNRNIPFSAFVEALHRFIRHLVYKHDNGIERWKQKIQAAVGDKGQLIIDIFPSLLLILGPQPAVSPLLGTAAQARLNQVFKQFIQVFAKLDHPLVIFLDDLQWADLASIKLLEQLATECDGYLLILGAYRDNEVVSSHPLMRMVKMLDEEAESLVNTIILSPLSLTALNQFTADTLKCSLAQSQPLTNLIYQKAQGNPFFTHQYLKKIYDDSLLTFDPVLQSWYYDETKVQQHISTNSAVELVTQQLEKLSETAQTTLKLAACIGNKFNRDTFSIVYDGLTDSPETALQEAFASGMILSAHDVSEDNQENKNFFGEETNVATTRRIESISAIQDFQFSHDQVQLAVCSLIPDSQKQVTHLKIGQLLLAELSPQEQEDRLFELVHHLNSGKESLTSDQQKQELAQLNIRAGAKAKLSAAYAATYGYYQTGICLLPETAWQTHYKLMYQLHYEGAEAAYLCRQFQQAEALYAKTLPKCQSLLDTIKIYRIQMTQFQLQSRYSEAISIQRESLQLLGWTVPTDPEMIESLLRAEHEWISRHLKQHSLDLILNSSSLDDPHLEEMMRILQVLFYSAWLDGNPDLALLAVAKMTKSSLKYGHCEMSPFGYVGYGMLLVVLIKDYETAYGVGKMAVQLCEQFDNADVRSMTNFLFAADVQSWSRPIREADTYFEAAYLYGMEAGNWLTVSFMTMLSGSDYLTAGKELHALYDIAQTNSNLLRRFKSLSNLEIYKASVVQPIRQLLGLTPTSKSFTDSDFNEDQYVITYKDDDFALAWFYAVKIRHAYLFREHLVYMNLIDKFSQVQYTVASHTKTPSTSFYMVLMRLALVEKDQDGPEQQSHWEEIDRLETNLRNWADACAENIEHKCLIIAAEKARLHQKWETAGELYAQATTLATANRYHYEAALAYELAAQLYFDWDKPQIAEEHILKSHAAYYKWGALAKLQDLEQRYPDIFKNVSEPISA